MAPKRSKRAKFRSPAIILKRIVINENVGVRRVRPAQRRRGVVERSPVRRQPHAADRSPIPGVIANEVYLADAAVLALEEAKVRVWTAHLSDADVLAAFHLNAEMCEGGKVAGQSPVDRPFSTFQSAAAVFAQQQAAERTACSASFDAGQTANGARPAARPGKRTPSPVAVRQQDRRETTPTKLPGWREASVADYKPMRLLRDAADSRTADWKDVRSPVVQQFIEEGCQRMAASERADEEEAPPRIPNGMAALARLALSRERRRVVADELTRLVTGRSPEATLIPRENRGRIRRREATVSAESIASSAGGRRGESSRSTRALLLEPIVVTIEDDAETTVVGSAGAMAGRDESKRELVQTHFQRARNKQLVADFYGGVLTHPICGSSTAPSGAIPQNRTTWPVMAWTRD